MKSSLVAQFELGIWLAIATLAGCNGSQPPVGASGAMPQASVIATRADRGKSWMLPEAKKIKQLLYISSPNIVFVYDYKTGKQVGQLTNGFDEPYGQCVDANGDVFIANYSDGRTDEYARGGTTLMNRYTTDGDAIGCSVNSRGDLAVTDFSTKSGAGQVCVWRHSKGRSTCYSDSNCHNMWPAGYDSKGNLYVESDTSGGPVCELPRGSSTMKAVVISGRGSPYSGGSVMWDGKYITLAGYSSGTSYYSGIAQATESSSGGLTIVGNTELKLSECASESYISNTFIVGQKNTPVNDGQGRAVIGTSMFCYGGSNVVYWAYPEGGEPISSLDDPPQTPQGESVSIAP